MKMIDTNRLCIHSRWPDMSVEERRKILVIEGNQFDDAVPELIGRYAPIAKIDYSAFYRRREDIGKLEIEKVIYNDPATIVFWKNGDKTVVKCQPGDTYDPEKGLALCIMKRALGNKGNYNNVFREWLPEKGEQ